MTTETISIPPEDLNTTGVMNEQSTYVYAHDQQLIALILFAVYVPHCRAETLIWEAGEIYRCFQSGWSEFGSSWNTSK